MIKQAKANKISRSLLLKPITALALTALAGTAQASAFFPTFNQGALQRNATLPALGEAHVLAPGDSSWYGAVDLTTEYYSDANATESVLEDGESTRIALSYRGGFEGGWEWNAQLPVLVLGGGFLDSMIEGWHDTFGLPNGGRELAARDQYHYRYVRGGATLLDVTDSGTQLGDLRLGAGWRLNDVSVLRAQLKLPTGEGGKLGGGNTGLALWLDHALGFAPGSHWSGYVSAGGSWSDESDVLPQLQQQGAGFGGVGLSYRATDALSLTSQLYAHTALFKDTELNGLSDPGLQFVLGLAWKLSRAVQFNLAFQEDPIVASSPDFSLHFGVALH